jgi:hypothetical protein
MPPFLAASGNLLKLGDNKDDENRGETALYSHPVFGP